MGMEQTILFDADCVPRWSAVFDLLERQGFAVQVRMIDNELALPDTLPPDSWRELRVGTPQGMVTLRREPDRVRCITWGNADTSLIEAWNALAWAFALAGPGRVALPEGPKSAADFARSAALPVALRGGSKSAKS